MIGFGGPNAHIAMIEEEVVKRRSWLSQEQFLDLLGATNLIPGPNSTEMAIHIGYLYAGWLGLIVAGVGFILPAVVITAAFAWVYMTFGTVPQVGFLLYGIKPAVLAIIVDAVWRLGKKAVKSRRLAVIAIGVALWVWVGRMSEVLALLIGGILGMIWLRLPEERSQDEANLVIAGLTVGTAWKAGAAVAGVAQAGVWELGSVFLKIGSILFGGGYVLLPLVQGELVDTRGWLTQQQLLDAIAIGQFTPGPILSTATFIGYVILGIPGAIVATVGMFLPSFLFVAALNPVLPWLRRSPWTSAFLDAVNVSAVGLMVGVTAQLGIGVLGRWGDWVSWAIALVSGVLVMRYQVGAMWLVIGGMMVGWIAFVLGYRF
jgi:chromate transporter